ncbi:MAG: hypothetical protein Q8Q73_16795 [Stagnimonas sp.]|nr:hypothetical protein [Stagnimonas sp.]
MVRASASLPVYAAIAGFTTVGLACLVARDLRGPRQVPQKLIDPPAASFRAAEPIVELPVVTAGGAGAERVSATRGEETHYARLRSSMRWMQTRLGNGRYATPDHSSRLLLAKSAAQRAGLHEVGLGWRDVYGIITAETSWVPRLGRSKDGTPNLGVAQFEPATARALGLRNPDDVVESVHVAAEHMKEAAQWSASRIAGLKLAEQDRAARLREGVSIYYNLSSRGRAAWNGRNTDRLPIETKRHIANSRLGAQEAALLEGQVQAARYSRSGLQTVASSAMPDMR